MAFILENQELCFDRGDFDKDDFSVDNFLDSRGTNFEILRDDLGRYLKDLRSAMIELINQDYSDFVNLSSNLIGLDKSILKLRIPLCQFKEEILQIKCSLDEGIEELTQQLDTKEELIKSKESLKNLRSLMDLMDKMELLLKRESDVNLHRMAAQLAESEVCKANCNILSIELIQRHISIEREIFTLLDNSLLNLLSSDKLGEDNAHRMATKDCLKIYASLGKIQHVEELVRNQILVPKLKSILNEQSARSTVEMYNQLLLLLNKKSSALNLLISISNEFDEVRKFDFLLHSYWPEVSSGLLCLNNLFSPGDPNEFYKKFNESQKFIVQFEAQLITKERVLKFRARDDYSKFLKKWNLIVYYQIRFQEIAGTLEKALVESKQSHRASSDSIFELDATQITWDCVLKCFAPGLFLPQLLHKFWKLALQLFSRISSWTEEVLVKSDKLEFLCLLHADLKLLSHMAKDMTKIVSSAFPLTPELLSALEANLREIQSNFERIRSNIVQNIINLSCNKEDISKSVADIPRLYRRTNRGVPSSAGAYMDKFLLNVVDTFHSDAFRSKFGEAEQKQTVLKMVNNITSNYLVAVKELLTSVQKTEDSLRKLKQIRDKSSSTGQAPSTGSQSVSDDDKIRMQIQQDLLHFAREIGKLGISSDDVTDLKELNSVVEKSLSNK
ncbi:Hypothetical predicted protein [Cloeon dipterum]|uniref:Conserved oligomeric Golgi complex subunit 2 n=1 Tax=Cloeon dipterum TaxID=197152 RepID=A0A8S1CH25_9INSE|nr:Hypothetical predicted protein [Cloeon dipterum]